jgi:hypothetical protein
MQLTQTAWVRGSAEAEPTPAQDATPTLVDELGEAIAKAASSGHNLGDAFVFGRCSEPHERAIARSLPADTRVFGCMEGAAQLVRGRTWVDAKTFDDRAASALRARHRVHRVSVVIVADDFGWSLGRIVQGLRSLLAPQAALLVAGRQAALLENLWLDELRRGQRDFEVDSMGAAASSWARLMLRRRQMV